MPMTERPGLARRLIAGTMGPVGIRGLLADTRPLRVPAFRRLWTANIVTVVGAQLTVVAVPAQIYAQTGSSAYVGLTGVFGLVPLVVFGLYGGALADVFDRRTILPHLVSGDAILSRRPFIASTKAVVAEVMNDEEWLRVVPPMSDLPTLERQQTVADFLAWDAGLPLKWQSFARAAEPAHNVVGLRRA